MVAPRKPVAKSVAAKTEPAKPVAAKPVPAPVAAKFTPPAETVSMAAPVPAPEPVAAPKLMEAVAPVETAAVEAAPVLAPIGELQEMFRAAVESHIEQSKAAYARLKSSAEEATGTIETAYKTASAGSIELNNKAIDLMRDNTNAMFDFAKSLTGAKSLSEVVVLQTEHARKQFETFSTQAKEFSGLVQKVATDSAGPLNAAVAKGLHLAA
jgi:phasin